MIYFLFILSQTTNESTLRDMAEVELKSELRYSLNVHVYN